MRIYLCLEKLQLDHMLLPFLLLNIFQKSLDAPRHFQNAAVQFLYLDHICFHRCDVKISVSNFSDIIADTTYGICNLPGKPEGFFTTNAAITNTNIPRMIPTARIRANISSSTFLRYPAS